MNKLSFLAIATCFAISSCSKLLNEDVRSQITDDYISTEEGFENAVNAGYSFLKAFYGGDEYGASITVFGTDLFTNGFDGGIKYLNTYDANLNPRNAACNAIWNSLYMAINTCNAAINRAPGIGGMDENLKNVRVAECRFLRAEYYFLLVQLFGPVPLKLQETRGIDREATRAPLQAVYDSIIEDLNDAVQTLPVEASDYGRATKPAAEHLLAKVYLTKASSAAKQQDDYDNAAKYAENVINNYNFKLLDDYSKIFEEGAGEKNSEVIWSVQNSKDFLTVGLGNTLHLYFIMKYDDLPGLKRDIQNGRPYARFKPTVFTLQQLFDRQHDGRFEKIFKRVFYCNNPGTFKNNHGETITLNTGDTAIYLSDRKLTADELKRSDSKYSVYNPEEQTERVFPVLNKFLDPERPDMNEMRGSRDFLAMRLSETYLIAAEALMMTGQKDKAVKYINIVRRRAAKTGHTDAETNNNKLAMEITPDQLNIDFILDERGRELLGELTRWFDLVRTGKLIERVKKYNPVAAANIKPYHILRPIPQDQIDRSSTEMEQNEGY